MVDNDVAKICNFFLSSPEWIQQEVERNGSIVRSVKKMHKVPDKTGVYWMHGFIVLKSGRKVDAVFVVDTDMGGELLASYWRAGDRWYSQDELELAEALGLEESDLFPYDYVFTVPLERDAYHA